MRAVARDGERHRVGLRAAAVEGVVGGRQAAAAGVVGAERHEQAGGDPARGGAGLERRGGGRRRGGIDVDVAGVRGLDVAGLVDRPVGDHMRGLAAHRERRRVGLRAAAVERVVGGLDARRGVAGVEGDRLRRVDPARGGAGLERRGGSHRRRRVDPHGAGTDGAAVAGVVDGIVVVGVAAVARAIRRGLHGERAARRQRPRRSALRLIVGAGDAAAAAVVRGELHRYGGVVPRRIGVVADRRRGGIDVDVAGVRGLDVAGLVDRPVGDRMRGLAADRERRRVGLRAAAVDRVVGGLDARRGVARRRG